MAIFIDYIQNIKKKNNNSILLFFIILLSLKIQIISFKYFKAFNLLSNDLLLISDEGIIKYNTESVYQELIVKSKSLVSDSNLEYITLTQFPSEEGGYIICRINEYIYALKEDATISYGNIKLEEIKDQYIELVTYTSQDSKKYFIICYINSEMKITLIMYEINFTNFENSIIKNQNTKDITYEDGTIDYLYSKSIACKILDTQNKQNTLTCFVGSSNNLCLNAISFDQDNNFSILEISQKYYKRFLSEIKKEYKYSIFFNQC